MLLDGFLSARMEPTIKKHLLNVSAIIFVSVISSLLISKLFGKFSLHILDFPITAFMTFQLFLVLFLYYFNLF